MISLLTSARFTVFGSARDKHRFGRAALPSAYLAFREMSNCFVSMLLEDLLTSAPPNIIVAAGPLI